MSLILSYCGVTRLSMISNQTAKCYTVCNASILRSMRHTSYVTTELQEGLWRSQVTNTEEVAKWKAKGRRRRNDRRMSVGTQPCATLHPKVALIWLICNPILVCDAWVEYNPRSRFSSHFYLNNHAHCSNLHLGYEKETQLRSETAMRSYI